MMFYSRIVDSYSRIFNFYSRMYALYSRIDSHNRKISITSDTPYMFWANPKINERILKLMSEFTLLMSEFDPYMSESKKR